QSNGAIDLEVNGGTPPYSYLWSNGAVTQDLSGLAAGSYDLTVTDGNGCQINETFTINDPAPVSVTSAITNVSCNGGTNGAVNISINGGTPPYGNFSWSNGAVTEDISGLSAGSYTINLTDANGCPGSATFNVSEPPLLTSSGTTTHVTCNG